MKITPADYVTLESLCQKNARIVFHNPEATLKDYIRVVENLHPHKVGNEVFVMSFLNRKDVTDFICDHLYTKDLNDTHINTAFKKIYKTHK